MRSLGGFLPWSVAARFLRYPSFAEPLHFTLLAPDVNIESFRQTMSVVSCAAQAVGGGVIVVPYIFLLVVFRLLGFARLTGGRGVRSACTPYVPRGAEL